jgi:hypothetical protein
MESIISQFRDPHWRPRADKENVERRIEPRLKVNQPVVITEMGWMPMPSVPARVLDLSGSGLQLRSPNPVPCGSPVKVASQNAAMLGEVCRCESDGDGYIICLTSVRSAS